MSPTLPFATYDVFTDTRFAGNPLAVVFEADGLDAAHMQAIAREFNLSETVFVHEPAEARHRAQVRIFTPAAELPFAGHPTIGAAIAIVERGGAAPAKRELFVLEEQVGPVRCAVEISANGASFAEFDSPKLAEPVGPGAAQGAAAAVLSLEESQIGFDRHIPSLFSAGVAYAMIPVASLEALAGAKPQLSGQRDALGSSGVFVYARAEPHAAHAFRARMFAPELGVVEDPATGSAAAAFAGVAARFEGLDEGWSALPILQGVEMGRPSLIGLEVEIKQRALAGARIAGKAVLVSEGRIRI